MTEHPPRALYVHVPFCLTKCGYCDFYSVERSTFPVADYLRALEVELELTKGELPVSPLSVYVGGGTPTALTEDELDRLLTLLEEAVELTEVVEFSVEANPGTLTRDKLSIMKQHGVNRLSLGAQSFTDRLLSTLGRCHDREDVLLSLTAAQDAGFSNVSLDLIFGIPTETRSEWTHDLEEALRCRVSHVSAYCLTYEEGTPLAERVAAGEVLRLSEEEELWMFETVMTMLTSKGYEHYEVSNFARPGLACRHNEVYWANEPYFALGPSAVSYCGGERRRNAPSLEEYVECLNAARLPVVFRERLEEDKRARETAVMNLRRTRGLDFGEFLRHTGFDARVLFRDELAALAAEGLMELAKDSMRLSRRGMTLADSVLSRLV